MNAPEKIYLQQYDENTLICLNKWNISEEWSNKPLNEKVATNIEYARTDTFIEKAKKYLTEKFIDDVSVLAGGAVHINFLAAIENFVKYLKEE